MYVGVGIVKLEGFQPEYLKYGEVLIAKDQLGFVCIQTDNSPSIQSVRQYTESICRIIKNTTIIPVRFGTIFEEEADIYRVLQEQSEVYTNLLIKFHDLVEVELKISWNKDNFPREMLSDKKLSRWKKALEAGKGQGYNIIEFGKAVQDVAVQKRQRIEKIALDILFPLAKTYQIKECTEEFEAFNGIFLLARSQEEGFDQAVDVLYEKLAEGYKFKYTGPWPVHHFIEQ